MFIFSILIALSQACINSTVNGKCYYCCGNSISIENNRCLCDNKPCPTCFEPETLVKSHSENKTKVLFGKPFLYTSNTSMEKCPEQCSDLSHISCLDGIPCDSRIYSNGDWVSKHSATETPNSGYTYMRCDYKHHTFELSAYTLTFCNTDDCSGNTYSTIFHEGCNQPGFINGNFGSYCTGKYGWVAGIKC